METKKKVQLVLGSGGARGIAHIGVIEMLRQDGFEIESVVGCSMGAVVGGIFCAGSDYLDVYRDWLLTINRPQLFNLMDFTLTNMGFLKGEKVLGKMHDITGDQLIQTLPTPFVAVATDMVRGKEVYFREGDLYTAMRASMSIPGIFTPVIHGNSILVDGGVLNPLPLNLVEKTDDDTLVVAVSLNGQGGTNISGRSVRKQLKEAAVAGEKHSKNWIQKFLFHSENKPAQHPKFSLIDLMSSSYEFTQDKLVELTVQAYKPDILIDIPRSVCSIFDFHKADYMLDVGREAYQNTMASYRRPL